MGRSANPWGNNRMKLNSIGDLKNGIYRNFTINPTAAIITPATISILFVSLVSKFAKSAFVSAFSSTMSVFVATSFELATSATASCVICGKLALASPGCSPSNSWEPKPNGASDCSCAKRYRRADIRVRPYRFLKFDGVSD